MKQPEYTSIEQAWDDLQGTPSYVQRYQDDPNLYPMEEAFTLVVVVSITDLYTDADHVQAEKAVR